MYCVNKFFGLFYVCFSEDLKQAVTEKSQAVDDLKNEKEKLVVDLANSHKDSNIILNVCYPNN